MIDFLKPFVSQVVPMVYTDEMSFVELLAAVTKKINELIATSNEYFSVDIKTNLENLLKEWQASGELEEVILDALTTEFNAFVSDDYNVFKSAQETINATLPGIVNDVNLLKGSSTSKNVVIVGSILDYALTLPNATTQNVYTSSPTTDVPEGFNFAVGNISRRVDTIKILLYSHNKNETAVNTFNGTVWVGWKVDKYTTFDVVRYGAFGDGAADDTTAIQSTINAASAAGGGVVVIPPGSYKISQALNIPSKVVVSGESRENCIIRQTSSSFPAFNIQNATVINMQSSVKNLTIRPIVGGCTGIKSIKSSQLSFDNIRFQGCSIAFNLDEGRNITINDIIVVGSASPSALAAKSIFKSSNLAGYLFSLSIRNYQVVNVGNGCESPSITFDRCVATTLTNYDVNDLRQAANGEGIYIAGDCQGVRIMDSLICAPYSWGVNIARKDNASPLCISISNVHIDQSAGNGIIVNGTTMTNINGCMLTSLLSNGVWIKSGANVSVNNNDIYGGGGTNGVLVDPNVSDFRIQNNRIQGYGTGIGIVAGSGNRFIVSGNDLSTAITNPLLRGASGTSYIVDNNLT